MPILCVHACFLTLLIDSFTVYCTRVLQIFPIIFTLFQYHVHFFKTLHTFTMSLDYANYTVGNFPLLRYKMHSMTTSSEIHGYLSESMFTTSKTLCNDILPTFRYLHFAIQITKKTFSSQADTIQIIVDGKILYFDRQMQRQIIL